jgi:primosomal protein DnaI
MKKKSEVVRVEWEYPHSNYLFYIPPAFHHCTLDNFDWKGQSKDLSRAVEGFVEGDIKGLYLYGNFGVGKTHLMVALYRVLVAKQDDISDTYYTAFEELIHECYSRMDTKEPITEYLDFFCDVGLLFIDDITAVLTAGKSDFPRETLRKIINKRYENELRTCFTSNLSFAQMMKDQLLHQHAISRIQGMCTPVLVKGRDRRIKESG